MTAIVAESVSEDQKIDMDGVIHLYGNLYRMRLDLIHFADTVEKDVLSFKNPRLMLAGSKPKGFSKEEMSELRESVRTIGLENPMILRPVEFEGKTILQLISGERRTRCCQKLVKDDADCYNPATGKYVKASDLYEYVEVRINHLDDRAAWKSAYSSNDKAVDIGDGATIALIREWRNAGWTDDEILETTGKSISWLRDTDVLIGLDEETFDALKNEQINRSVALEFAKIEDVNERLETLKSALNFASTRLQEIKKKLAKAADNAEDKLELAEAQKAAAELGGDKKAKEKAEVKATKLAARVAKKKAAADDESTKVNSKDLQKARSSVKKTGNSHAGEDAKALTRNKIQKHWYAPCAAHVKGAEESDDFDNEDARLVILLSESIEKGNEDIFKILKHHKKMKDKRAS